MGAKESKPIKTEPVAEPNKPGVKSLLLPLEIGDRTYEFDFMRVLGSGSFGTVYEGRQTNIDSIHDVAIKLVNGTVNHGDISMGHMDEIIICNQLRNLNSKYLVTILDVILSEQQTFIVMELISGGSLRQYISSNGAFDTDLVWTLARHMTWALVQLRLIKIVHRVIKPDNILVAMDHSGGFVFKLTDFGVSRFLNTASFASTLTGTPGYNAPEALTDKYDNRSDIFSLGVVLLECAVGEYPFPGVNSRNYAHLCVTNQINISLAQTFITDPIVRDLLSDMLKFNQTDRVGLTELTNRVSFVHLLDEVVLTRIFYYTGFKDRVTYETVNKKWQKLLQSVWAVQEGLVFGRLPSRRFDCIEHQPRKSYKSTAFYNDKTYKSFIKLILKSHNLKYLFMNTVNIDETLDLSILPTGIVHLSLEYNSFVTNNFYAPNLTCLFLEPAVRCDEKLPVALIKQHRKSLMFIRHNLMFCAMKPLNELTNVKSFIECDQLNERVFATCNREWHMYIGCGCNFGETYTDVAVRSQLERSERVDILLKQLRLIEIVPHLFYTKLDHELLNTILFSAENLEILVLHPSLFDQFMNEEDLELIKLKTCIFESTDTSVPLIRIKSLETRFPKLRFCEYRGVKLARTDVECWVNYANIHPKRQITLKGFDIQSIKSESVLNLTLL